MNGLMYQIKVKNLSKLKDYGFKKEKVEYEWLGTYAYNYYSGRTDKYGKAVVSIVVYDGGNKPKQIQINSCGGAVIKVICELYKDNIIEFVEFRTVDKRIEKKKEKIAKLEREIKALWESSLKH